ncbi:MAG: hypothetical protein EOQ50_21610 [Mesorhizobium sp.]|uniref:hypothetical protein n=1 Tax=Mesorhizobium sp. TaxID=1871066 RepID=UPI000FE8CAE7|nr:hypothetical protein [Mesorhizobium sp.]RWB71515.1 MAG: hypothetical protein EOQ50_21610 [Mesorhizobium sp.]
MSSKRKSVDELRDLSDAIDESILAASDDEIDEELALLGLDPTKVAVEMEALAQEAKKMAGRLRLERAKQAMADFHSKPTTTRFPDRAALRSKFDRMRSGGDGQSMTMAARKGKHLSSDDEDGALDDLAQLEALEAEDPEAPKE